jgi:endonuclease YncB( thermonuclease family)
MGNGRLTRLAVLLVAAASTLSSCAVAPEPTPDGRPFPPTVQGSPQPPAAGPAVRRSQTVLVGTVMQVTDGDTIKVQLSSRPISVRFDSIDAPEKNQPWGLEARAALAGRLDGQQVALDVKE